MVIQFSNFLIRISVNLIVILQWARTSASVNDDHVMHIQRTWYKTSVLHKMEILVKIIFLKTVDKEVI